jgi:nitrate/TMAO reductase-like tetraheme cytochrome c subunit
MGYKDLDKAKQYNKEYYRKHAKKMRARSDEWYKKHPEVVKDKELKKKFGISFNDYQKLLENQSGVCAICHRSETYTKAGKIKALSVDHNHITGKIRELLCSPCNVVLGLVEEDPSRLEALIAYLEKHK